MYDLCENTNWWPWLFSCRTMIISYLPDKQCRHISMHFFHKSSSTSWQRKSCMAVFGNGNRFQIKPCFRIYGNCTCIEECWQAFLCSRLIKLLNFKMQEKNTQTKTKAKCLQMFDGGNIVKNGWKSKFKTNNCFTIQCIISQGWLSCSFLWYYMYLFLLHNLSPTEAPMSPWKYWKKPQQLNVTTWLDSRTFQKSCN